MTYRVNAKDLDVTTTAGATAKEIQYELERRPHAWLKAKYRPKRGSLPQWGTGGDYSGRARPKGRRQNTTQIQKVLVIGPTGKRSWETL